MNDFFNEQLIKKQLSNKDKITKIAIGGVGFIVCILLALIVPYIGLFLGIMALALCGYLINRFDMEYEYIITNSIFEVDYIYAKRTRKKAMEFDLKEIIAMVKLNENKEQHTFNTAKKTYDFTSRNNDEKCYKAILKHDGENVIIKIEPNDKVLEGIKRYVKIN